MEIPICDDCREQFEKRREACMHATQVAALKVYTSTKQRIQKRLEEELERLKAKVALAGHLRVVWAPKLSSEELYGMVKGSTIYVFNVDEESALLTLKHEYVEYILTNEFLEPRIFEAKAHRRADALVDILASLI